MGEANILTFPIRPVRGITPGVNTSTGETPTGLWARHLKARGLRPATISAYIGWVVRLERYAGPVLGLSSADLERWVASQQWAPNSHQKAVQAVRYFYAWALDVGLVVADPAAALRPAKSPRPVPNPCPEDVYRRALDSARGVAWWRLRLAADTGLRRSELAGVHSDHVRELVTGPHLKVAGKGGTVRWVPLPADLAAWVTAQKGWAFPAPTGGPMKPGSVGRWYARRLGVNAHRMRHRYATRAYSGSHDINAVRALLGHASVTTTQVYVAVAGEDLKHAAAAAWDGPGLPAAA